MTLNEESEKESHKTIGSRDIIYRLQTPILKGELSELAELERSGRNIKNILQTVKRTKQSH